MDNRRPAEVFPPGEFIKDELEARNWTQEDLAWIMGRDLRVVNEIIKGRRSITPETARALGEALGTTAQYWMNLQAAYQLASSQSQGEAIPRRSRLYEKAPVRLMVKRNWIEATSNIDVLEERVRSFFLLRDIRDEPRLMHAYRKSTTYKESVPLQQAWLYRAVHLARAIHAQKYTPEKLNEVLERLRALLPNPQDIAKIPDMLAGAGIKFMVIEPLPQSKIDGVTFWENGSPVIALSLRYDRIDYFWHTLCHELAGHVKRGDGKNTGPIIDVDLPAQQGKAERPLAEIEADKNAVSFLVLQSDLDDFVSRARPLYTAAKIRSFAGMIGVHPGIVVGQLQFRQELSYAQHRDMLVRVRDIVTRAAVTDGWGNALPVSLS